MKKNKKEQKFRIKLKKAARRSGKVTTKDGKLYESKNKRKFTVSKNELLLSEKPDSELTQFH